LINNYDIVVVGQNPQHIVLLVQECTENGLMKVVVGDDDYHDDDDDDDDDDGGNDDDDDDDNDKNELGL